jgi:hypothetical protein
VCQFEPGMSRPVRLILMSCASNHALPSTTSLSEPTCQVIWLMVTSGQRFAVSLVASYSFFGMMTKVWWSVLWCMKYAIVSPSEARSFSSFMRVPKSAGSEIRNPNRS